MDMNWTNSGRYWRTGEPGMQTTGSEKVIHDFATKQQPQQTIVLTIKWVTTNLPTQGSSSVLLGTSLGLLWALSCQLNRLGSGLNPICASSKILQLPPSPQPQANCRDLICCDFSCWEWILSSSLVTPCLVLIFVYGFTSVFFCHPLIPCLDKERRWKQQLLMADLFNQTEIGQMELGCVKMSVVVAEACGKLLQHETGHAFSPGELA